MMTIGDASASRSSRAVLLGAGHAHLDAIRHARSFTSRGFELVVVAPGPFWYSGLATGMLGGEYSPEEDQVDVARLVERRRRTFHSRHGSDDRPARAVRSS